MSQLPYFPRESVLGLQTADSLGVALGIVTLMKFGSKSGISNLMTDIFNCYLFRSIQLIA